MANCADPDARWAEPTSAACRERSGSCAASIVGDGSRERLRPGPSKSRAPRRPPRCPARLTDPAPLDRQAVPSSSGRFPACPSASPEAPFCPPGSRQSVRECIRPAAPCAPADRRRRPRHKHSVAPTDRWLASADSRPPSRSLAARSPKAKDWAHPCRARPSGRPENSTAYAAACRFPRSWKTPSRPRLRG